MVTLVSRKKSPSAATTMARSATKLFVAILALYGIINASFFFLQTQATNQLAPLRKGPRSIQLTNEKCESPLRGHFDKIYRDNIWGMHVRDPSAYYSDSQWPIPELRKKSASGAGSDLGNATQTSLKIIKETIVEYEVTSMIDVPCGDANWMFESFITDHLPLYIGLDVVSAVIDQNKRRFEHHVNKHFHFWDATLCPFPKFYNYTVVANKDPPAESVELIHVRDVIQHLTLKQGVAFFCNVFKSGARVLITTTFPDQSRNRDIGEGKFYPNNLSLEPFSFPQGKKCVPTHPGIESDYTCVYNLTDATWVQDFVDSKC
jgi:hypothetical protein